MDKSDNETFFKKTELEFRSLFALAKQKNELHFAFSLTPEFRPYSINSVYDFPEVVSEYLDFIVQNKEHPLQPRVALALYSHISEASGFWEIPKNLLSIIDGNKYNLMPFKDLVKKYGNPEGSISPNSNKIMRSLMRYSAELGFNGLGNIFKEAFNAELRNGYAHADYVLFDKGICVGSRYGKEKIISWDEFTFLINRAINFYEIFMDILRENLNYYSEPKIIKGHLEDNKPEGTWKIHYDIKAGFSITGGIGDKA